ncbi:MAG: hypothetical protein GZ087_15850 [Flavobacterium sp.]|nr:hypothetical protein [Flavobacterium sp.]
MKLSICLIAGMAGVLLLCSCGATRISENSNYKDSEFVFGPSKTAVLVGNDQVLVNEFTKTFNKKYKQKHDFVTQYDSLCSTKLKEEKIFGQIQFDKSFEFVSNDPMTFNPEQQKKVDSLFTYATADYLIRISNHEVTNKMQGTPVCIWSGPMEELGCMLVEDKVNLAS